MAVYYGVAAIVTAVQKGDTDELMRSLRDILVPNGADQRRLIESKKEQLDKLDREAGRSFAIIARADDL